MPLSYRIGLKLKGFKACLPVLKVNQKGHTDRGYSGHLVKEHIVLDFLWLLALDVYFTSNVEHIVMISIFNLTVQFAN